MTPTRIEQASGALREGLVPAPAHESAWERRAAWAVRWALPTAVAGLCLVLLASWAPHYLCWTFWPDHDHFATMALAWDAGVRPYRDLKSYNFPGQIYVFWLLGRAFGWGRTLPFFAADAAMVGALGLIQVAWSVRRFGRALPGLLGYLAFLGYYLGLGYDLVGQRDWQCGFFAFTSVMVLEAWPGRVGRVASAVAMAAAAIIRPQAILLGPAVLLALDGSARRPGESWTRTAWAILEWGVAAAVAFALALTPIAAQGLLPDMLAGIRRASPGGTYSLVGSLSLLKRFPYGFASRLAPTVVLVGLLAAGAPPSTRRTAWTWVAALLGVLLVRPLSPVAFAYHDVYLWLDFSLLLAALAGLILASPHLAGPLRLAMVLLVLQAAYPGLPRYCQPIMSLRAIAQLGRGEETPEMPPTCYHRSAESPVSGFYRWADYRGVLDYLRTSTGPETRVANLLIGVPAITAPTGRLPVMPTESVALLAMYNRAEDLESHRRALERAGPDSVVVWSPREKGQTSLNPHNPDPFRLDDLIPIVERHYRPEARFGTIEVWRRTAEPASAGGPTSGHGRSESSEGAAP